MHNANMILPPGTQIVTRAEVKAAGSDTVHPEGAVAVIIKSPADHEHSYRVRFADQSEAPLRRTQFAMLKHEQRAWPSDDVLEEFDLRQCVIYRCVVGSRAYGLDQDDSDTDRRGVYLPPAEMHWSLYGVPEQLENAETEECYWELQKFLTLALKANPNVLECLFSPIVEHATPLAEEMLAMRDAFLSRLVYQTYNGYVLSQFKKLTSRLNRGLDIKWKHAMHLIRLLLAGITVLREGTAPVAVGEHREKLLAIRQGELDWPEIDGWRLELHRAFDAAYADTKLPERPDYARANALLIKARCHSTSTKHALQSAFNAGTTRNRKHTDEELIAAHRRSSNHRQVVEDSERCGCFYCGAVFRPQEIAGWIDGRQTALCPRCNIDSVLPSASGYPITDAFLLQMSVRWFGSSGLRARLAYACPVAHANHVHLLQAIADQRYPLLFVTISGAHLYGFPSADSDYDLRGVHLLPLKDVIGLHDPRETIEHSAMTDGIELDLVTHDAGKFFRLMLKRNGYVLEQLLSPLVLQTTPEHAELVELAHGCITRHHAHHYLGFARTQWDLFAKERRVKPLLYTYRVLLTGIHLMRTGDVEANLVRLNEAFQLPFLPELIEQKLNGAEKGLVEGADFAFHEREVQRLTQELEQARDASALPETPTARDALNDLLIRLRTNVA